MFANKFWVKKKVCTASIYMLHCVTHKFADAEYL